MTTPRTRFLVSLAAALTVTLTLALGGCASAPSRLPSDGTASTNAPPLAIQFDNEARDYVHVYLVGARREWFLGRVEPAARATLRIPETALAEDAGAMWLAVLAGERISVRVAGDARAATAIAQPLVAILSQQWTFSPMARGQLTAIPRGRRRP